MALICVARSMFVFYLKRALKLYWANCRELNLVHLNERQISLKTCRCQKAGEYKLSAKSNVSCQL